MSRPIYYCKITIAKRLFNKIGKTIDTIDHVTIEWPVLFNTIEELERNNIIPIIRYAYKIPKSKIEPEKYKILKLVVFKEVGQSFL